VQQPRHGLLAEMTAAVLPLVVLVLEHRGEEAHQRGGVGKDAHHLRAAVELGVDALDALDEEIDLQWSIGNVRWARTSASATRSLAATLGKFGSSTARACATASAAVSAVGCRRIDFTTASTAGAWSLGTALAKLRRNCTLQRCQVAPVNTCVRALRSPRAHRR
jgi:hypothetical protein